MIRAPGAGPRALTTAVAVRFLRVIANRRASAWAASSARSTQVGPEPETRRRAGAGVEAVGEDLAQLGAQRDSRLLQVVVHGGRDARRRHPRRQRRSAAAGTTSGAGCRRAVGPHPVELPVDRGVERPWSAHTSTNASRPPGGDRSDPLAAPVVRRAAPPVRANGTSEPSRAPSEASSAAPRPSCHTAFAATSAAAASAEPPARPADTGICLLEASGRCPAGRRTCAAAGRQAATARLRSSVGSRSSPGRLLGPDGEAHRRRRTVRRVRDQWCASSVSVRSSA